MKNKGRYYLHGKQGLQMSTCDGVNVCLFDKTDGYRKRKASILEAVNSTDIIKDLRDENARLIVELMGVYNVLKSTRNEGVIEVMLDNIEFLIKEATAKIKSK